MGPLGGTQYGMYAGNSTYDMCTPVLDIRAWPRGNVPGLRLTDTDVGLLRRVDYDILAQILIGLIKGNVSCAHGLSIHIPCM
jgi:hypothetical protein